MVATQGLASFLNRRAFQFSWRSWLIVHLTIVAAIAPWVRQYLDHAPESTNPFLSLKLLLGMPIAFIGGNFATLLICLCLIAYGLFGFHRRENGDVHFNLEHLPSSVSMLLWLTIPSLFLYVYSHIAHPIFGPARYTLYVGPPYLILISRGLAKLSWRVSFAIVSAGTLLSGIMLVSNVYRSDLKANWRGAAAYLIRHDPSALVTVLAPASSMNTELSTARYYVVPPLRPAIPWAGQPSELMLSENSVWVAIGHRHGRPEAKLPAVLIDDKIVQDVVEFSGLRLIRLDFRGAQSHAK